MNAILGYVQLMLRDPGAGFGGKSESQRSSAKREHLLALINDVLDMSKIEAGRTELKTTLSIFPSYWTILRDVSLAGRGEGGAVQEVGAR